jgi:hypothetical protein
VGLRGLLRWKTDPPACDASCVWLAIRKLCRNVSFTIVLYIYAAKVTPSPVACIDVFLASPPLPCFASNPADSIQLRDSTTSGHRPSRSYMVQSSIFQCFNWRKERSLVTKMASAANAWSCRSRRLRLEGRRSICSGRFAVRAANL